LDHPNKSAAFVAHGENDLVGLVEFYPTSLGNLQQLRFGQIAEGRKRFEEIRNAQ
jgi:hypothetical protein